MLAKITGDVVEKYPYSIGQLRKDNAQVSLPQNPSPETLAAFGVFEVVSVPLPDVDISQDVTEGVPQKINGVWTQVWNVSNVDEETLAERKEAQLESIRNQRAAAYREEADPLYFKAQRGEAEVAEWEAKVQDVRNRFPYPEVG